MDPITEYARGTTLEESICARLDLLPEQQQRAILQTLVDRYAPDDEAPTD